MKEQIIQIPDTFEIKEIKDGKIILVDIFPELKESEDERIRKQLLNWFKDCSWDSIDDGNLKREDIIAWLKKQGEQKPKDKPKFKVGDWITNGACTIQITSVDDTYYWHDNDCVGGDIESMDKEYHFWTIQDAKDGDVLVSESNCGLGTWYCIFKSLDDDESMTVYCYLARDGRFETKKELCFDKDPFNTKPATKEQRDLLFQKMKEAGYEWDAEKKELKEIEQKPAWSEEDERMLGYALDMVEWYIGRNETKCRSVSDWLKSIKHKLI